MNATLTDLIKRAERDNSLIYLQAVTSSSSLPPINSSIMVKATSPPSIEYPLNLLHTRQGGLGASPLFSRLLPHSVQVAIELYMDRKDQLIREELSSRKDELDSISSETLQKLNLPGAIQALELPKGLPNSLMRKREELKRDGGSKRLRILTQDALSVASTDQKVLEEVSISSLSTFRCDRIALISVCRSAISGL